MFSWPGVGIIFDLRCFVDGYGITFYLSEGSWLFRSFHRLSHASISSFSNYIKEFFSLPLFLQPLPFVFLGQCCDFLAGKHQSYICYFQSVKQYHCPFFPEIALQSANNLVLVIHNSLGLSVKFSQPDVIVHRDLVRLHPKSLLDEKCAVLWTGFRQQFLESAVFSTFSRKLYFSRQGHSWISCPFLSHLFSLSVWFWICTSSLPELRLLCCNPNILWIIF